MVYWPFSGADDDKKSEAHLIPQLSVHEQEEGIIMAMCITGTSDKDSLVCWINLLQVSYTTSSYQGAYTEGSIQGRMVN